MSRIEDMTVELGVHVSHTILHPEPGDLLVLKCGSFLSREQRERFEANVLPPFQALGCKVIILEGGTDVQLIKKAGEPVAPVTEVARKVSDNLQLGQSFGSSVIRAEDLQAEMQPGEAMTAVGFTIDPLESAIDQTVRLIAECQGNQEVRLTSHLDQLLALQLKRAE